MNNPMKVKRCTLALASIVLLVLSACGRDPAENLAANPAESPAATIPAETAVEEVVPPPTLSGVQPTMDASISAPVGNGQAKCNIETLAGQDLEATPPVIPKTSAASIVGWYVDPGARNAGNGLKLVIHNEDHSKNWVVAVAERTDRQDVADSIDGSDGYIKSGFSLSLDLSALPAGYYGAYLTDDPASAGVCALGRTFGLE